MRRLAHFALCVTLLPQALLAQHHAAAPDSPLDSLAAAAARLTTRFADRRVALREGYRRLGADFPGMGEHWLHPVELIAGRMDANRPTLLIYATIDRAPRLLGVGFVATTRPGERAGVPGWPHAWHEHSGLLASESGAVGGTAASPVSDTQVWVLHAWTGLANPDGAYAPDNWALPFARLALPVPHGVDAPAARALALADGGDAYLRALLTDAALLTTRNAPAMEAVLARGRGVALRVAARARARGAVSTADVDELRDAWHALERALRAESGDAVARLLAPPHPAAGAPSPSSGRTP